MRRWLTIASLISTLALIIVGARFLLKASSVDGWESAAPALTGVACFLTAGVLSGRQAVGLIVHPITALIGSIFHPGGEFTETPKSQLLTLRAHIAEGRFKPVEHQITGLLKAYPRDPGLYHVWALLQVARGLSSKPVTEEASRELSSTGFAEYEALLRAIPPRVTYSSEFRRSQNPFE